MANKSSNSDDKGIDWILSLKNKNAIKTAKPIPTIIRILILIGLSIAIIVLFCIADQLSLNQATILGVLGSTAISIFVVLFTIDRERREVYREAQKSALLLSVIIHSVNEQIYRIQNGARDSICYPANWFEYYSKCASFLEYEYSEILLREFSIAQKINQFIANNQTEELYKEIKYRNRLITDSELDFDIYNVAFNLSMFATGGKESKSWKSEENYKEFKEFFLENYTSTVVNLTKEYLAQHSGSCDSNDAEYFVMNELRKEAALNSGKYKFQAIENKKMLSVIFSVYLSLKEDSPFSLCWGELTLKT